VVKLGREVAAILASLKAEGTRDAVSNMNPSRDP